ncbi:hypothetical protein DFR52_106197 [Hoeflea marina]|uniref:PAS domain-containing protein n=1 Tax=Hoeflea marina TaxID=274592 RepID=A0A317PI12_9HYPH|nr:hypothetical protein [Hoeflea marina]PWV97673.1 hypothetical protein DFR52_106197 [Hoeflea marina]
MFSSNLHRNDPPEHSPADFAVSAADVVDIAGTLFPLGLWRAELDTGLFYWSAETFRIHGMEFSAAPINLKQALSCYHAQDVQLMGRLVEDAAVGRSDFSAALRLGDDAGGYRQIVFGGRYRDVGAGELIGYFHEVSGSPTPK